MWESPALGHSVRPAGYSKGVRTSGRRVVATAATARGPRVRLLIRPISPGITERSGNGPAAGRCDRSGGGARPATPSVDQLAHGGFEGSGLRERTGAGYRGPAPAANSSACVPREPHGRVPFSGETLQEGGRCSYGLERGDLDSVNSERPPHYLTASNQTACRVRARA
jgi:hypothetical protein